MKFSYENIRQKKCVLRIVIPIFLLILAILIVIFCFIFIPRIVQAENSHKRNECKRRDFDGMDSFVCVCSANYCDQIEETGTLGDGQMVYFLTSRDQHRLDRFQIQAGNQVTSSDPSKQLELRLNKTEKFQSILGFGGAFTDSVGILLNSLNPKAAELLLREYFHKADGIGYTMGRVPIASTDFSTRVYSYADIGDDFEMKNFRLAIEDLIDKIPHILIAKKLVSNGGNDLNLVASPWSPPWWMKENGKMTGGGPIKGNVVGGDDAFYRAYAKYLRLFFEEYAKFNVTFWGMTLQNEPFHTIDRQNYWQALYMPAKTQREFIYYLLSPELKSSKITSNIKIMALDEQRRNFGEDLDELFANETEAEAIDGLAVHWYSFDGYKGPFQAAHSAHPNKFILATEASCGDNHKNGEFNGPQLGNWTRGWLYGHDILNDMNIWVTGWIDWNLCLNPEGGPTWYGNTIDAAVIVNSTAQEFYKQPMFYFLAHFSHFIPPESVRISSKLFNANKIEVQNPDGFFLKQNGLVEHIAFVTPDGNIVAIILNGDVKNEQQIKIIEEGVKMEWQIEMPPDSIVTAIFKPK